MPASHKILILLSSAALALAIPALGQDEQPSLGDAARQARLQKQQKDAPADKNTPGNDAQSKDAPAKDAQAKDSAAKDVTSKDTTTKDGAGKNATTKDGQNPKVAHVITNDEIPSHVGTTVNNGRGPAQNANYPQPDYTNVKIPAEQWKSQIQAMKNSIASMQSQLSTLNASIQYAGGNCVANCVEWNERQKQKQDQADAMKAQLEQMQKRLEDMQDMARQQGYGTSVYDP